MNVLVACEESQEVFMVQGYKYSKPSREVKYELCEWCFRCVTDEVINGKAREVNK